MATRVTPDKMIGTKAERLFGLDRQTIDQKARTVDVAFASPTPVQRWWGDEILDISTGAIRGARLDGGAAVLVDHRSSDHVGVVEGWRVEGDRARATLRFGKGARAQEIFDDIVDGIRRHISVGYIIHGMVLQEQRDDGDTYRITDWEPYEISIVGVPADPDVGVGRSAETAPEDKGAATPDPTIATKAGPSPSATGARQMNDGEDETITSAPKAPVPAAPAAASSRSHEDGAKTERERAATILDLGARFNAFDQAREFVATGKSVEDFKSHLLEKRAQSSKPVSDKGAELGLSDKERRGYSFMRVLRALSNPTDRRAQDDAGLELEAHHALLAQGRSLKKGGILVPDDVLRTPLKDSARAWSPLNTATTATNTGDSGGNVVPNELMASSFIDILRNKTVMMRLGRTMTGLVGTLDIPKKIGKGTGGWIGEDGSAAATSLELDQISMSPKTVAAYNEVTRRMLMQSSLDVEALVRADLAAAVAETIDTAALYGDPDGGSNEPRGLKLYDGINTVDFAGDGAPTFAELVQMETEIASDNADVGGMAYLLNATMRGYLKTTQKFSGTTGATLWEPGNTVNGYRTEVTNQIAAGELFFGNFSDMLIGMWGGFELAVDPYTHSLKGRVRFVVFQDVDFVLRRTESFCYGVKPAP